MINPDIRWKQRFENYRRALRQLTAAVELARARPLSELERQGLIQGFEFTYELAWNVLKDYLEFEGIQGLVGARSTIREAFKRGLVAEGETWMDMIDKRNFASHTYHETIAQQVAEAVVGRYHPVFVALEQRLGRLL